MKNLRKIDFKVEQITTFDFNKIVLIGFSGKMYIPTKEELLEESFSFVTPFVITDSSSREEVLKVWNLS